jgi:hypothetical protein
MSADIARVAALIEQGLFCDHAASILPSLSA